MHPQTLPGTVRPYVHQPGVFMDSKQLLAAVRADQGLPSNYALARFLNVRENTLHRWHSGRNTPDDLTAARLAELAGLDPCAVVAEMHAQRATEPAERALWEGLAARLAKAGAAAVAAVLALFITIGPDGGVSLGQQAHAAPVHNVVNALYIAHSWMLAILRRFGPRCPLQPAPV